MLIARYSVLAAASMVLGCSSKPAPVKQAEAPLGSATEAPPPAPAAPPGPPAEPTCKTVERQDPDSTCSGFATAPRAEGAAVASTDAIFQRLAGSFRALSGRETALAVLSPQARGADGGPILPAAYICPGVAAAPPTIYVPATLLALVDSKDRKKYPDDFLAFVLGHELGHRMNDLTSDGCPLPAGQRPGKGANEEELADARSAFFITTAGFSASAVARADMVGNFLEMEYKLRREDFKTRKDALLGALSQFDAYEALYQAALSVSMIGDTEAADRLLSWTDDLVQSHGVPLPEVRVVRAITRIERAKKIAPWLADLGLPVGIEALHCTPLHPGHSSLWQEPEKGVRAVASARGRKLLKEALALLDEAEARGATPFTVAAARTCAHLYLADATAAAEQQARAESLLPATADATVKGVLAENRALVTFVSFVRSKPAPSVDKTDELRAWTEEVAKAVGGNRAPAGLASVITALRDPGAIPKPAASTGPACVGAKKAVAAFAALPAFAGPGKCPTGYRLAHVMPPADGKTSDGMGLTVCAAAQGDSELVTVRVPVTEPKKLTLERTMLSMRPPAELADLGAWACQCESLERQGVSDRGQVLYRAQCAGLKLEGVLAVTGSRVDAVIHHSR